MFDPKLFWNLGKTVFSTEKGAGISHGLKGVGKRMGGAASRSATKANTARMTKGYMYGTAAAIPIGVGAAIASEHPLQGIVNNVEDMAWGDPSLEDQGIRGRDVDNRVLGHDISFADMFLPNRLNPDRWSLGAIPSYGALRDSLSMENIRNTASWDKNQLKTSNKAYDMSKRQREFVDARGAGTNEYFDDRMGIPYRPSVTRGPIYSSGDQVLGMYNRRHR